VTTKRNPWDDYLILWNWSAEKLQDLVLRHGGKWVLDSETNGLCVRGPEARHGAWYVGLTPLGTASCLVWDKEHWTPEVKAVVNKLRLIGQNIRFDIHACDLAPEHDPEDTLSIAYFSSMSALKGLDDQARKRRRPKIKTPPELKSRDKLADNRIGQVPREDVALYLADDCVFTSELYESLDKRHADYLQHDFRLERVVAAMEHRGIRVYTDRLDEFEAKAIEIESQLVRDLSGLGFDGNPASPKQVLEWLGTFMDVRKLPPTKTSRSTSSKALKNLHLPQTEALIAVRSAKKLQNGFIAAIREHLKVGDGSMVYPSVHTSKADSGGTSTGRWSMSDPPLHQAPKRHKVLGPLARRCFTSRNGYVAGADYSQLELRVAAALSGEPVLLEAFAAGRCPHSEVAAKAKGIALEQVTPEIRFGAKAVNFGILNSMGPPGLAIQLDSDARTARRWLDDYLKGLPTLATWMEDTKKEARDFGVLRTCAGRTRIFGADESTDTKAVSVVVQGSAAELIRHAVVALEDAGTEPFLQMHDEVLCQNQLTSGQDVANIMTEAANKAFPELFSEVDFATEGGQGDSWAAV